MSVKDEPEFIELRYVGERFQGGRLPLDVLGDLATFREVIIELAKSIWLAQHPNRKRIPRGFDSFFRVHFSEVTEGSAVAHIRRESLDLTPLFADEPPSDIFEQAQSVLLRGLAAANDNSPITQIPRYLFPKIGSLGKRLLDHEQIVFRPAGVPNAQTPQEVTFSRRTREAIAVKAGVPIARVVNGFGILRGANETRSIISVLAEFGEVELEVEAGQVRSVYDGKIGFVVEFDIEAQFSAEERISKVISTKSVDLVEDGPDIPRISDRLTSFTKLSEGWLDGEGLPVSNEVAETALDLSRFVNSTYSDLRVYPTTAGGVRLEYSRDDLDVSIEIDADLSLTLHALDLETEKEKLFKDKVVSHDLLSLIMNVGELS